MSTEAQKRASTNYNRKQDNIMIRPAKEEGAAIRAAAQRRGNLYRRMFCRRSGNVWSGNRRSRQHSRKTHSRTAVRLHWIQCGRLQQAGEALQTLSEKSAQQQRQRQRQTGQRHRGGIFPFRSRIPTMILIRLIYLSSKASFSLWK